MTYRITTTWNDGAVTTDTRATFASATKVARRNRSIGNVVLVTIGSASWPEVKGKWTADGDDTKEFRTA